MVGIKEGVAYKLVGGIDIDMDNGLKVDPREKENKNSDLMFPISKRIGIGCITSIACSTATA